MKFKCWKIFFLISVLIHQPILCNDNALEIFYSFGRGFYNTPVSITLRCANPAAVIRYTTDCSLPSMSNGFTYKSEIEISSTTVVKAIAFTSTDTSIVKTHTYLFPEDIKNQGKNPPGFPVTWGGYSTIDADYEMDPEVINATAYTDKIDDAIKSIPALSLSMSVDDWFDPDSGNYVGYPNTNETREKPVSAEFIYLNSNKSFEVNCGVQNQGGTSIVKWKVPKQSMRLLFKDQYGQKKLNKKLFPDSDIESINTVVVDALLYSWIHSFDETQRITSLYFRDQLCSDLQNAMGGISFHGIYVNLFINGLYWGIYDVHERPDEDFMEQYFEYDKTDFDIIKHNPSTIVSGSNESYLELLEQARKGFSTSESLIEIQKYLDLPAFIDYMILNFYLGNYDWAHQNYYAASNMVLGTGYRFFTWDAEHVMRYSNVNYNATKKNDSGGPTEIHTLLKTNSDYRMMFADAFYKHAFNNGALSIDNFENEFMYRKNELDLAIILESARWGDYRESKDNVTYTRDDYWIPEVNKVITEYIPNRRDIVIEQLQKSYNLLYPKTLPPEFSKASGAINPGETIEINNPNSTTSTVIYTTDGSDPRQQGGDIQGDIYNSAIEINKATIVKARVLNSNTNEWSPLAEAYLIPENITYNLVITEIMYHSENYKLEFIEIMNSGDSDIDLAGVSFIKGIDYTFDKSTVLTTGEELVLTNNMVAFNELYGFEAYGMYSKQLSDKGETIILADFFGNTIDIVSYIDTIPWPVLSDQYERSMELINPELDNLLPSSWKTSSELFGSPGEYIANIKNAEIANKVLVYPNPASEWINIVIKGENLHSKDMNVDIYNSIGQLVKQEQFCNGTNYKMNINDLGEGFYMLQIIDLSGDIKKSALKLIKQ
jgi:hypothetical protein